MNGAAAKCQQEQVLHPQHNDTSSLHVLQTNYSCQEQTPHQQYSKAMNYKLLPDNFSVDGPSKHSQYIDSYSSEPRNRLSNSDDISDNRINPTIIIRETMELPVPMFEIDENSVGVFTCKTNESISVQDPKDLDLDTRIDLLIKSKALSGMHPIFSDLNESDSSSTDSEEQYSVKISKCDEIPLPKKQVIHQESFDDPEKPLSRPPSPFLSRATYLFWFNRAIELKQQAKVQEQALLEKATKMLIQGNLSGNKVCKTENSKQDSNLLQNLLSEVSKELKESIKQDFIKEIIENTVLNSLEDWWVKERQLEEGDFSKDFSMVSSTTNDNLQSKDMIETNESVNTPVKIDKNVSQGQISCSPHVPSNKNKNQKFKKKLNILENQVTSIIELNKTPLEKSDPDVLEEATAQQRSVATTKNDYLESISLNNNCTVNGSSFEESNLLNPEEIGTNNLINGTDNTSDIRNTNSSNNDMIFIEKSNGKIWQDVKNTEESGNRQRSPVMENLPPPPKNSVEKLLNENILVEMEQAESSENSVVTTVKALDILENLSENGFSSKDSSKEKDKKEESCIHDLINNKENNAETKQNDSK